VKTKGRRISSALGVTVSEYHLETDRPGGGPSSRPSFAKVMVKIELLPASVNLGLKS
jgi:hypothetical protein